MYICSAPAALISRVTFITELHTPLCSPRYLCPPILANPHPSLSSTPPLSHPPSTSLYSLWCMQTSYHSSACWHLRVGT